MQPWKRHAKADYLSGETLLLYGLYNLSANIFSGIVTHDMKETSVDFASLFIWFTVKTYPLPKRTPKK